MSQINWNDFTPVDDKGAPQATAKQAAVNWDDFTPVDSPKSAIGSMASDALKSFKSGVEQLPGMVTGIADLAPALAFNARPFTKAADAIGEATGFQPGKWAKETQYSPNEQAAQQESQQVYKPFEDAVADPTKSKADALSALASSAPDIAKFYATHPLHTINQAIQSVPAMLAGGAASKLAMGAGALAGVAADPVAGIAARAAVPSFLERAVGEKMAAPVAGGIGEGAMQTGQQMDQGSDLPDQRKNALASLASGAADALISAGGGRLANKMGLETPETLMAKGLKNRTQAVGGIARNVVGGALSEGALQELPQSMQEQVWQNYAEGKPLMEGVVQQGIEGGLSGGLMGAGANIRGHGGEQSQAPVEQASGEQAPPLVLGNTPDPLLSFPDGSVARQSEVDNYLNSLPEEQRAAARAKLMGLAPQPTDIGTSPGAADPNATQREAATAPQALDATTAPGAAPDGGNGVDFTREFDTSGLNLQDPAEAERARAATVDYAPTDTTPNWGTAQGAAPARQGLDMPAPEFDTSGLSLDRRTPSQRMGIDPTAGPLSSAAAMAVDSGAHAQVQQAQALQDAAKVAQKQAPSLTQQAQAATQNVAPPANLRDGLARIRAQRQEAANAQAATQQAAAPAQTVPAARAGAVEAAGPAPVSHTTTGVTNGPEAAQAQQSIAQPTQAGDAARPAATSAPNATGPAGGRGLQAAGVSDAATAQNDGAQGQAAAGAAGTAPAPQAAVARPDGWRKSMLRAVPVAKGLGIDHKGKRLAQLVAEIDAADAQRAGVQQDGADLSSGQIDRSQPGSTAQVMRSLAQQFRDRHAVTQQDTDRTFAGVLEQFANEVEEGKRTPQSVQQAIERYRELADGPKDQVQTGKDAATHADPGRAPEAATPSVVADSLKTAARNEGARPSDMRKWLIAKIDEAIAKAPEVATEFLYFDVPGDGKFKVANAKERLQAFRKQVLASPGFKDRGQATPKPATAGGVATGSATHQSAINNMIEEGDFVAARDYAEVVGFNLDGLKIADKNKQAQWAKFRKDGTIPLPPDALPKPAPKTAAQNDAEKANPVEEPGIDYKGFTRTSTGNDSFDLIDSNLRVRVEPTGRDKYQASVGNTKSSPHLQGEQGAADWADAYRAESIRAQKKDAVEQAPAPSIPAGYKPAGEPFYRGGKQIQGYAPFAPGERVTMKESAGQSGVVENLTSPDDAGVFSGAMVKFDNGSTQIVKFDKLEAEVRGRRFNIPAPPTLDYRLKHRGGSTYLIPPVGKAFTPETRSALRDWARDAGFSASIITDNEISVASVTDGPSLDYIVDGVKEQAYGRQADKERAAIQSATGARRDPAKVSMFNPYEDGDIVTINGQDWTVKQDTPGWYLTTTGNWRGQHPTIRNVKAMADLIRAVEQAAVAQPAKAKPEAPKLTAEQRKVLDDSLRAGAMSVEDYMKATGLTDEDVGTFQPDGLRAQAEQKARAANPYYQLTNKIQDALSDQMKSAMDAASSTPQQRKSKEERIARITRDRSTLDMLTRKFEHPFNNNYVSKLSPILKSRFNKQFEGVKTGEFAKAEFNNASYQAWAELLIEAAGKKAVADGFVERGATVMFSRAQPAISSAAAAMEEASRRADALYDAEPGAVTPEEFSAVGDARLAAEAAMLDALAQLPDSGFAVEARTSDGRMLIVTPSASEQGRWQLTRFGKDGEPWGDTRFDTKRQALQYLVDEAVPSSIKPAGAAMSRTVQPLRTPAATPPADSNARNVATQMLVDGLKAKWTRAPEIIVARNMQDPQIPQRVRDYDAKLKSQGATGETRGFIYQGQVYLLSDQLKGPQQIAEVLFHEVLGHYGLRGVFGEGLTPILQQLGTMRRKDVLTKAREYGLYDKDKLGGISPKQASDAQIWAAMSSTDRTSAAEEVLAEMAQTQPTIGFVKRAIALIRNWLRANMPGFKSLRLTDADIVAGYILPARGFVTRSNETPKQSIERAMLAFSRTATDQTQTEAFKKWFGDSKVVDADGKPLVVYHGTAGDFNVFDGAKASTASMHATSYLGHYFSESPEVANEFVPRREDLSTWPPQRGAKTGGNVMPVHLAITNPYEMSLAEFRSMVPGGRSKNGVIQARQLRDRLEREWFDGIRIAGDVSLKGTMGGDEWHAPTWIAFRPEQIKSATGNRGTFDPANPDIRFSRTSHIESSMGEMTPTQEAAYKKVAGVQKVPTARERLDTFKANLGLKMKQALVDQFAPIQDVSQQAYMLARMSKGSDGATEALLLYGKPYLRDGVLDVNIKDGGFAKVLASLKGEHDRFFMWVAAQRAERLKAEGKENLMGDEDITALRSLNAGKMADGTVRMPIYAKALQELNAFNEASLKVAQESGLIDQAAYDLMKDQPYVPFYRLMEEQGGMTGPRFSSGLLNQKAWKKLKGGTQQLNADLMQNSLLNWSHLYAAAARNRAALATMDAAEGMGVAYKVGAETKGAVKVMRDGMTEHWMIEDPYLLEAVSALNYSSSPLMKPLSSLKKLLTWGVTVNPAFKIRNLIRDSIAAVAQSPLGFNPAANVARGLKLTATDSQVYASMLASGGIIKFGTQENSERLREQVAKLGGVMLDKDGLHQFTSKLKGLYEAYQEIGDRTENVNRAALYDQLIKKGYNHADASFMARDLMDFSMSGSHPAVRFLTQTVPFLNARLQGLYKLGRAAKEDPKKFAAVVGAVSLASLGLLAAYSDDDDWKKREDWDRDSYWWFKIGDTAYRIPKPFEVGAIGTIAERTAELMFDKEMTNKRFMDRIGFMVGQTFSFDPTPQAIKPLLDIYANKDSFTQRSIESQSDQRLRPQDRYNERTSEVARLLGSLGLPDPGQLVKGDYAALSPKQVDYLLHGYFSWVATAAATVSDFGLRPVMDRGERPDLRLKDIFLAGNFVESLPTGSSRYVTQLYDQAKSIEQAYASYQEAIKQGDTEKALSIKEGEGDKLRKRMAYANATKQLSEINSQAKRIESNRLMSGEVKRERLTELELRRDKIARRVASLT